LLEGDYDALKEILQPRCDVRVGLVVVCAEQRLNQEG
jgi:hypothetical protein